MRLAIISDIHGNQEALVSVLDRLHQEEVDSVLNLGDLVGYNASPAECLALLKSRPDILHLAGNHDLAVLSPERAESFNIIAYQALGWCRKQLLREDLDFLGELPLTRETPGWLACHGTPTNPDAYIAYHFQGKRVLKDLSKRAGTQVCFFGHTHRRAFWYRDIRGKVALQEISSKVFLSREGHYLINPGSVGKPRDGNPEAAYAIFDETEFSIQFKSVPYDLADSRIVGDATLHMCKVGWKRHLGNIRLVVAKDYQGKGLGTLLINEIMELAGEFGLEKLVAEIHFQAAKALATFKKAGFSVKAVFEDLVKDPQGRNSDLVVMVCDVRARKL